jgi:hypothetical protein
MGRTACTEPQCLYSRAIPLLPLWAVQPVQSLSACKRVTFTLPLKQHQSDSTQFDVSVLIPTITDIVQVDVPPVDADSCYRKAYKKQTVIPGPLF